MEKETFELLEVMFIAEIEIAYREGYKQGKEDGKFFGELETRTPLYWLKRIKQAYASGITEGRFRERQKELIQKRRKEK